MKAVKYSSEMLLKSSPKRQNLGMSTFSGPVCGETEGETMLQMNNPSGSEGQRCPVLIQTKQSIYLKLRHVQVQGEVLFFEVISLE